MEADSRPAAGEAVTYKLDPARTAVRFETRHMFNLGRVLGAVDVLGGLVSVDAASGRPLSVEVDIDLTTFRSGDARRDANVVSDKALNTAKHPIGRFVAGPAEASEAGWKLEGQLTANGVTAALTLRVDAPQTAAARSMHASGTIDRTHHEVWMPSFLASKHLQVDIDAVAQA